MMKFDVVILGAGAAGMMCAIEAARRGRKVLLIDHAKNVGEKIRISGGGRCNFTNLDIAPEKFLSQNPRFALSALARYTQWDFIELIAKYNIPYHEKTLGQLFCDGSAKEIISMLLAEMRKYDVTLWCQTSLKSVHKSDSFQLDTTRGILQADSFVVATGGKSIPKMGASGIGCDLALQFGLALVDTRPALVPLTFGTTEKTQMAALAGLSVDAVVRCNNAEFREGLLFTHRGLSGPSILQISSYWREGQSITIDLCPGQDVFAVFKRAKQNRGKQAPLTVLADILPRKLAEWVLRDCQVKGNLADQTDTTLKTVATRVQNWQVYPTGSEGYRTAEVMLGGVDTDGLHARTMEARKVAGLYFIGEIVDVTGWLGGYNFQWAWSSGWAAGQVV